MVTKIIFNQNIKLDEDVAWLAGFYFAEDIKNKNSIGISNKEVGKSVGRLKM